MGQYWNILSMPMKSNISAKNNNCGDNDDQLAWCQIPGGF